MSTNDRLNEETEDTGEDVIDGDIPEGEGAETVAVERAEIAAEISVPEATVVEEEATVAAPPPVEPAKPEERSSIKVVLTLTPAAEGYRYLIGVGTESHTPQFDAGVIPQLDGYLYSLTEQIPGAITEAQAKWATEPKRTTPLPPPPAKPPAKAAKAESPKPKATPPAKAAEPAMPAPEAEPKKRLVFGEDSPPPKVGAKQASLF